MVQGQTTLAAELGQGTTGPDPLDAAMTVLATRRAGADRAEVSDGDIDNSDAMFAAASGFDGAPRRSAGSGHDEQLENQPSGVDGAEQVDRVTDCTTDQGASVHGQRTEQPQSSDGSDHGRTAEETAGGPGAADAEEAGMEDGSRDNGPSVDEPMTDLSTGGDGAPPADVLAALGSLAPPDPGRSPVLERPLFHVEPEIPTPLSEEKGSVEPAATVDARAAAAMDSPDAPAEESVPGAASEFHVEPAAEGDWQDDAGIPTPAPSSTPAAAPAPAPTAAPPPRPQRTLPRILAVANQKGGVGKTTTAVNLGAALAELGYRTLVVDLDPQGNATTGLGINARSLQTSVYDVLMRELPIEDVLEPTSVRNLFVVPATIDLAGAEIELVPAFSRELRLKRALDGVADDFDFTLIDCPPSLGLLTVNALAAAGEVVVPVQCEYYALEGLSALLRNVQLVQNNLNKALELSTIILTMYDARTKLAEQVAQEVRSHFGNVVCRNLVPRTVRLSEAPSYGQPIIVFDPTSRGAIAYRELAKEVSGGSPQRIG